MRNVTTQVYNYLELPDDVQGVAIDEWSEAWLSTPDMPELQECEFMADGRLWK